MELLCERGKVEGWKGSEKEETEDERFFFLDDTIAGNGVLSSNHGPRERKKRPQKTALGKRKSWGKRDERTRFGPL
jgi:hypothetical protein